jgi:Glycosyltransferases involved in cell wall biogenesis
MDATHLTRVPKDLQHLRVAVLLATYNGAQFVDLQIRSLMGNFVPFLLHWIDDHSEDSTRRIVRSSARSSCIDLVEWHQPQHLGVPGTFFRLLELVEADIYLFCDQDDVWWPGKIDATVANLVNDIDSPVLCFSDTLLFNSDEPGVARSLFFLRGGKKLPKDRPERPMLLPFSRTVAAGHTQGFTRPVREIFLKHKIVACTYTFMHDWWMHDITLASGTVRTFCDVPTVLWRQHRRSVGGIYHEINESGVRQKWRVAQLNRRIVARHAQGLVLAAPTLPRGENFDDTIGLARLISDIDRRCTPAQLLRLGCYGAKLEWFRSFIPLACVSCDAPSDG